VPAKVPYVAVIGGSAPSPEQYEAARAVGQGLATEGAVLVCGGRGGVMEAACRGAAENGGVTVGLLPGSDRAEANEWVTIALPTGIGELRNGLIVRAADGVIAVGGAYGTLSEIALALAAGKPVVGIAGTWEIDGIESAGSAGEAVAMALSHARLSGR
jgi:uncharacterized protein (TIGR00725 family)